MRKANCELCDKRPAEFSVYQVSKLGKRNEAALCNECARDRERILFGGNGLSVLDFLPTNTSTINRPDVGPDRTSVCPDCGNTIREVKKTGMMGCAACYVIFRDEVDRILEIMN
jgi:protein arginine kinase activator